MPSPCVIVNDYELLKEYFVKQGEIFAGRPDLNINNDLIGGAYGLAFQNNSWYKSQRRYALHVLRDFGLGRPILQDTIIDQANKMIQLLKEFNGEPVELTPYFTTSVGNVIFQLVFGYVREHNDKELHMFKHNFDSVLEIYNSFMGALVEVSPNFKKLDHLLGGHYTKGLKKNDEILDYLRKEIDQHEKTIDYESEPRDFIDSYLQEMRRREKTGNIEEFTDQQLLISVYDLFGAGLETTATASRTFIFYMLHYPEVQAKIHAEIDNIIGRESPITMADQARLPYLNATIQELQRIAVGPLNLFHMVLEDVQMGKYKIPKGTMVVPQIQSVHLDEKIFSDPEHLIPERHLDENGAFRKDERIMPFSLGKRACLGESLARMEIFLFISYLFQKFEFQPEESGKLPPFEYTSGALRALKPFNCRVVLRK
uniref:Cytochrome P450 n=1 Tax=Acrobeloides nanus TaxID=290746 RepID=A0A914ENI9_9BILA